MFVSHVFVHRGQWVANCPMPGCENAEGVATPGDAFQTGNGLGAVGAPAASCSACGLRFGVEWPDHPERIMAVLAERFVPGTRHWVPGETIADLEEQNVVIAHVQQAAEVARV